jgi:hypothetical protein
MVRLLRRLGIWTIGWLVLAAGVLVYALPWYPRSTVQWALLLLGGPPLYAASGFLANRLIFRSPIGVRLDALGKGVGPSTVRVLYVLGCFLGLLLCLFVAGLLLRLLITTVQDWHRAL